MKMTGKKKKKGRPLATPLPRDNSITIRLNSAELQNLLDWAFRYDVSVSEVVRDSLMLFSIIPES